VECGQGIIVGAKKHRGDSGRAANVPCDKAEPATSAAKKARIPRMGKTRKKNGRSGSIHDEVLNTALRLFSSAGYFNTSIHDIQRAANVSMGSIYNHFAGKEAIAKALYDDLLVQMEILVDQATAGHDNAHDRGKAFVGSLFRMSETEPEKVDFILNARHREFLTDEPAICSSRPFTKLRDIVLNGTQSGEIRKMDPWVAASLAFGPALRLISLRLDGMVEDPLPGKLDELWSLTWSAIQNRDA
jgi:AcrR family transcriptional regulator